MLLTRIYGRSCKMTSCLKVFNHSNILLCVATSANGQKRYFEFTFLYTKLYTQEFVSKDAALRHLQFYKLEIKNHGGSALRGFLAT